MRQRYLIAVVVIGAIAFGVGCIGYAVQLFLRPLLPEEGPRFTSSDGSKSIVIMVSRESSEPRYGIEYRRGGTTKQIGCIDGGWAGEPTITWLDNDRASLSVVAGALTLRTELTLREEITANPKLGILSTC